MDIRTANSVEAPQLVEILVERHKESRYADVCGVDKVVARKILAHAIHRHGGTNEGATFVNVAIDDEGRVAAFIFGSLARIYIVGDRLAACDNLLIGRKDVSASVLNRLFGAYVEWAAANPKVAEVGGSYSTAIENAEGWSGVFARRGFEKIGETWVLDADASRDRRKVA